MFHVALIAFAFAQASPAATQDGDTLYFPPSSEGSAEVGTFQAQWFSRHLAAAQEPVLAPASAVQKRGVLRFTWLRTFHSPIVVRVEGLEGDAPQMIAKQLSGHGGYDPGKIARQVTRPLTAVEASALRETIGRTAIFTLPPPPEPLGLDGAQWVFEGVDPDGYHLLNRWSPQAGPVRDMGLAMLALTGWELGEVY